MNSDRMTQQIPLLACKSSTVLTIPEKTGESPGGILPLFEFLHRKKRPEKEAFINKPLKADADLMNVGDGSVF